MRVASPASLMPGAPLLLALTLSLPLAVFPQSQSPAAEKSRPSPAIEPAFTIELLETRERFESDGTESREVHTVVRVHSEAGAARFSRLAFGYNRTSEHLEIPTLRVEHALGGSMEILPSAVGDRPVAAVADAPAYQEVREKFVRLAGLSPGDRLEYRVLTKFTHPSFAPDFFFSHSFSHEDSMKQEILEIDLPAARMVQMRISPATPAASVEKSGTGPAERSVYRWQISSPRARSPETHQDETGSARPDVVLSTFSSWEEFSRRVAQSLTPPAAPAPEITAKVMALTSGATPLESKLEALYDFVAQRIRTVDLPIGATGFHGRSLSEILASGYATPEDKYVLFAALASTLNIGTYAALISREESAAESLPVPSVFKHLVVAAFTARHKYWLEPDLEVAPFGMVSSDLRGAPALPILALHVRTVDVVLWETVPLEPPFPPSQEVEVHAKLDLSGNLAARVRYRMRGDNELLLRLAFHHARRAQWKKLAQIMAFSDGFRGQVSDVVVSDPLATHAPFTVEYAIAQPGLVNWTKLPVRLPIPLPVPDLPESSAKAGAGAIDLGTPLDIVLRLRWRFPAGFVARVPAPISVRREYAEFASSYNSLGTLITASRRLRFLRREVAPGDAADYAAFVCAVQNDQGQELTLERAPAPHSPASSASKPR